ncbi:MAG: helicase [Chthoniobacterales bacterium]|nr:helicase [Chthoniobacterales bacterium]
MTKNIVYFDLETQNVSAEVGGWGRKDLLKMSLGVTYSTHRGTYHIYPEWKVDELIEELRRADLVVGFNLLDFDYGVLMGYTILDLRCCLRTLDLLVDIEKRIGRRVGLDTLSNATLGVGKIADGLDAVRWYREGKWREIAEYCCYDVKVTKMLHEFGAKNGFLLYRDRKNQQQRVPVDWVLD